MSAANSISDSLLVACYALYLLTTIILVEVAHFVNILLQPSVKQLQESLKLFS